MLLETVEGHPAKVKERLGSFCITTKETEFETEFEGNHN
jgi:hypothetical protein